MPTSRSASPPTPAPCEDAERERAAEVDRERPERERARHARGDRAVEQEARDGARPAEEPDADDHERGHAASRARRTRLVVAATASKPAVTLARA